MPIADILPLSNRSGATRLNHFDAIKLGLTATTGEAHDPLTSGTSFYRYEYRRAVDEGFLVDYDAVTIKSGVLINGVFLKEGEQVRTIDTKSGRAEHGPTRGTNVSSKRPKVEKKITVPDTNHKIIEEIKKYALDHEQRHGRFPEDADLCR